MKQITKNVYEYKELNEKAREKALNWYRENNDIPFLEEFTIEDVQLELKKHKITVVNDFRVQYSLSHCQGDGLMFEGTFTWDKYEVTIKHTGYYYHEKSCSIDITTRKGNALKDSVFDTVYAKFKELYERICIMCKKRAYEYIECEDSEEQIKEVFEINEYMFYEDGSIHYGNESR